MFRFMSSSFVACERAAAMALSNPSRISRITITVPLS